MAEKKGTEQLREQLREGLLVGDGAMGTIREQLREGLLVGDGAMGTTLSATGQRHGLGDRTVELNAAAAALAREVAGDRAYVAGSIGPTGWILEPYGDLPESAAHSAFEEQVRALAEAGVDFLIVETMSAIEEALLAVGAAVATGLPVAASMAFDPSGRTAFGVSPQQAAEQLGAAGADVVGANCGTITPVEMVEVLTKFREATALPLIAQPNAGRPQQTDAGVHFPELPAAMAEAAVEFRALGATLIGGCCGSTPEHIRAIAARLRSD